MMRFALARIQEEKQSIIGTSPMAPIISALGTSVKPLFGQSHFNHDGSNIPEMCIRKKRPQEDKIPQASS